MVQIEEIEIDNESVDQFINDLKSNVSNECERADIEHDKYKTALEEIEQLEKKIKTLQDNFIMYVREVHSDAGMSYLKSLGNRLTHDF